MALTKVQKAKKLLNQYAPKGEKLAYINNKEAKLLKKLGGAGIDINGTGIKSYIEYDDSYGSGHASASSSSSDSSSNGGGGEGVYYPPTQPSTPAPTFDYESEAYGTTPAASYSEPDTSGDDQEEDVAQMMVNMGLTPDNAPTVSTLPDAEDDGDNLYVKPSQTIQINPVDEFGIKGNVYANTGFAPVRGPNVTYDTFASLPAPKPKGIFDSGIGKFVKNLGINLGGTLALGPGFSKMRTKYQIAQAIDDRFLNDKIPGLTKFAKYNKNSGSGFEKSTFESDGDNKPIPKDVITASVQKYSPEQINRAIALRDQLKLYSGKGFALSKMGKQTLIGLNNLIEQYQVSV